MFMFMMGILNLLKWLACGAALAVTTQIIKRLVLSPLRKIPGPKLAALTSLWMLKRTVTYQSAHTLVDCFEKYGPIVRIGPRMVVARRAEEYAMIYKRGGYKFRKSDMVQRAVIGGVANVASVVDAHAHGYLRRLTNPLFTPTSLSALYTPLHGVLNSLFVHFDKGDSIDVWKLYRLFTFDFMGEAAFGQSFGTLEKGESIPFMDDLDNLIIAFSVKMAVSPRVWNIVKQIPIRWWRDDVCKAEDRLLIFARSLVATQRSKEAKEKAKTQQTTHSTSRRYDMVSHLLSQSSPETHTLSRDQEYYNDQDTFLASTVLSYLIAGTETTATTMSWLTYALARHQHIQHNLRTELLAALNAYNSTSHTHTSSPLFLPYDIVRSLPYLSAFVKEGLRVYPPTSLVLSRVVPEGGCWVGHGQDGKNAAWLPEGTTIGCSPYALHRDPTAFPNPETFSPERWLVNHKDDIKLADCTLEPTQRQYEWRLKDSSEAADMLASYMPWSAGVRGCQGQLLAEMELFTLFANLVVKYRIVLAPECTDESMRVKDLLVLIPQGEKVMLRFERLQ